jgi:hypothetical protein
MARIVVILVAVAAVLVGCGSSKKADTSATPPTVLPAAQTADQWAVRIVSLVLRPLNRDLVVVNGFNDRNIMLYILERNRTTLRIIHARLGDLSRCSQKLVAIGPPPRARRQLAPVASDLRRACAHWVKMASVLEKATLFLSSGRADVVVAGRKLLRGLRPESKAAGDAFRSFLRGAQRLPEFRRAGLAPSA